MSISISKKFKAIFADRSFRWKYNNDNSPPEIYNATLFLSVLVFGILGSARGLDEGNISGSVAQTSFINQFGLNDPNKTAGQLANLKSNITSMVQIGSIGGALVALYLVDKLGRIKSLQLSCVIWIAAVIIQITSDDVGQLYAGRFLEGLCVGQSCVIGPLYLSEVAPKAIRGLCGCIFAGAVYLGIMLSYFANYGTAVHISPDRRAQWVIPTSMKIIFAGLLLISSTVICVESPRWLVKVGNNEKAIANLSKIRNLPTDHPYVLGEISDINEQLLHERSETEGTSLLSALRELIMSKSLRYRLFLGISAQVLGQWSGANAVTIYAPELFALIGKTGNDKLLMTAILGVVKFTGAYLSAFFIIDFLGRRKAIYIGITIQCISITYFATYLAVVPQAEDIGAVLSSSQKSAGKGAMAMLFLNGAGWTMGFNSIQYLINSEIFPLRVRNIATSLIMVVHFANQYGNTKALPSMLLGMNNFGAFYFFTGVLVLALFWAWWFLPEVSGRSLESMEELFNLPWYLIGRKGSKLCPDYSEINKITYNVNGEGNADNGHIDVLEKHFSHEFIENEKEDGKVDNQEEQIPPINHV